MEENLAALSKYLNTKFFKNNASTTQQECDQEAVRITGTPVHTTFLQDSNSYTVLSSDESRVVQFRAGLSPLNMDLIGDIEKSYGRFVPKHEFVGNLGELHVYTMSNVGGVSMYLAREKLSENDFALLKRTVKDYASFFASAWINTPKSMPSPSRTSLLEQYTSDLTELHTGLPERFRDTLANLISILPSIVDDTWPLVPNHNDLVENNIHVNKNTEDLQGIIDWGDATIGPFGISLGGLETMLGITLTGGKWVYHSNQQELRELFFETLYEEMRGVLEEQRKCIDASRLVGLFLEYGFEWEDIGGGEFRKVPASEGSQQLRYLEAFTLSLTLEQKEK